MLRCRRTSVYDTEHRAERRAKNGGCEENPTPPQPFSQVPPIRQRPRAAHTTTELFCSSPALAVMMARTRHAALCLMLAVLTTTDMIPEVGAFTGGLRPALTPHECSVAAQQTSVRPRSSRNNPAGTHRSMALL